MLRQRIGGAGVRHGEHVGTGTAGAEFLLQAPQHRRAAGAQHLHLHARVLLEAVGKLLGERATWVEVYQLSAPSRRAAATSTRSGVKLCPAAGEAARGRQTAAASRRRRTAFFLPPAWGPTRCMVRRPGDERNRLHSRLQPMSRQPPATTQRSLKAPLIRLTYPGDRMSGIFAGLRDGGWLNYARMRRIALAVLAASALGLVYLLATSDGRNDYQGRPLGTDFSNVYAAGTYVLEGRAAAPFDPSLQRAREQALFGEKTPFYGWHYPPFFLFIAAALALLPYGLALLVWQGATLALYLLVMRAVLRFIPPLQGEGRTAEGGPGWGQVQNSAPETPTRRAPLTDPGSSPGQALPLSGGGIGGHPGPLWLLLALAYPAVFINLAHGHNGFLTAALLGGGLVLLERRPLVAGVLFGLLAYKPQFGLMIPLALIASGRWRTIAAAAGTVALLIAVATAMFGPEVWRAFLASTRFTREVLLEAGDVGWHKMQSVFSWTRMWGGPVPLAYAMHGMVTAAAGAALVWMGRSDAAYPLKAAALCLAALLATPYCLDYDMMVLAPAIAFLAAHGMAHAFAPWEKSALAFLWVAPLIARSVAETAVVPIAIIAMLAMFLLLLHKAGLFRAAALQIARAHGLRTRGRTS